MEVRLRAVFGCVMLKSLEKETTVGRTHKGQVCPKKRWVKYLLNKWSVVIINISQFMLPSVVPSHIAAFWKTKSLQLILLNLQIINFFSLCLSLSSGVGADVTSELAKLFSFAFSSCCLSNFHFYQGKSLADK